jgi:hypothetical protein
MLSGPVDRYHSFLFGAELLDQWLHRMSWIPKYMNEFIGIDWDVCGFCSSRGCLCHDPNFPQDWAATPRVEDAILSFLRQASQIVQRLPCQSHPRINWAIRVTI